MHESESHSPWIIPMKPRPPDEVHRVSTPLELLFDLVFVVAVAQAAGGLHHGIAEGHIADTVLRYVLVFFGIWWAWMNFSWFASSYDTDDIPYRLLVFAQMTGALIMASGVAAIFSEGDVRVFVIGYVVMRLAGIANWLRAARSDLEHRSAALRYALGTTLLQFAWISLIFLPPTVRVPFFIVLALVELLIPVWAERALPPPWHTEHISERYGLFTIFVLGESILSTSVAIQAAIDAGGLSSGLLGTIFGGLLIAYAMWWLYFSKRTHTFIKSLRKSYLWAYGHLLIFGATAAIGAGIAIVVDQATGHAEISTTVAGMAVAIPTAIYVLCLWISQNHSRDSDLLNRLLYPVMAALILVTPFTGQVVLLTGILTAALVAIRRVRHME